MKETVNDKTLTLELTDEGSEVLVRWLGRSTAREPRTFLQPVLTRMLDASVALKKPLVLDFRALEYLNSSTITPVVRLLQQAKLAAGREAAADAVACVVRRGSRDHAGLGRQQTGTQRRIVRKATGRQHDTAAGVQRAPRDGDANGRAVFDDEPGGT